MAHHSSISNSEQRSRRALFGCCWAAGIVVAVDLACRALLPGGELVELEDMMRDQVESMPAPDIEVIGDSVARSGFVSSALGNDALTAGNVSTPASGAPKSYLLLARQFETGRVPKVLVIAHSPHTFGQVRYEVLVGGFAHWREIPGLIADAEKWTNVVYGVLTRLSYVLMHRDSFRELLTRADPSFFLDRTGGSPMAPDVQRLENLAQRIAEGAFDEDLLDEAGEFSRLPFAVEGINDKYFRRILALAKAHGVEVFWVTMPTPANMLQARSEVRYEQEMLSYLRQFEATGELRILLGEFVTYPNTMFRDWLHLNDAGAFRFACDLQALKAPVVAAAAAATTGPDAVPAASAGDRFAASLAPLCSSGALSGQ